MVEFAPLPKATGSPAMNRPLRRPPDMPRGDRKALNRLMYLLGSSSGCRDIGPYLSAGGPGIEDGPKQRASLHRKIPPPAPPLDHDRSGNALSGTESEEGCAKSARSLRDKGIRLARAAGIAPEFTSLSPENDRFPERPANLTWVSREQNK